MNCKIVLAESVNNMSKLLVIDGWHKGYTVNAPINQQLYLLKPKTITIDDCCDGEVVGIDKDLRKEYKLASVSQDSKVALYSIDGTLESIFQRDWIVPSDKNWIEQPLYIGIHDPRAVVDYTSLQGTIYE